MSDKLEDIILLGLRHNKRMGIKPGTQLDIAHHFGLSHPYVHQLIYGKMSDTECTRKRIKEICNYVGVDLKR
ncbi:hypothetical protein [Liquorilactobacillus capillatus]|nr:hypothetical protein [Liquorilactobacillus capillatus]